MPLHQVSGRWKLGLLLALATAGFWATLPIALKIALQHLDPYTITWVRFAFAFVCVGIWLGVQGRLRAFLQQPKRIWSLLLIAALMLTGNYVFYLLGLKYTTPVNAQLLIQLGPLMMALGGIFVFREKFNRWQWCGLAIMLIGFGFFFSDQLGAHPSQSSAYLLGGFLVFLAAITWALYALVQKQLLNYLDSPHIMLFIYAFATVTLLPVSHVPSLLTLDVIPAIALLYCAINTLGAYGAFAEALAHWEASRVSVVLALTPLLCTASVALAHWWKPDLVAAEHIAWMGWTGAALVVSGSITVALMRDPMPRVQSNETSD